MRLPRTLLCTTALAAVVAVAPAAADTLKSGDASGLRPLEAGTFVLGSQTVSVYYTVIGDTYEVVTTIAPKGGASGAPIRFVGFLGPGQKALVSAGEFGTSAAPDTLEVVRQGDLLSATRVTSVAVAN